MKPRILRPALVFAIAAAPTLLLSASGGDAATTHQPLLDESGYPLVGNLVAKGGPPPPAPVPSPAPSPPKPKPTARAV